MARTAATGTELQLTRELLELPVMFEPDSSRLTSSAVALLDAKAFILRANYSLKAIVIGAAPTSLDSARADAIQEYLVRRGVNQDRLPLDFAPHSSSGLTYWKFPLASGPLPTVDVLSSETPHVAASLTSLTVRALPGTFVYAVPVSLAEERAGSQCVPTNQQVIGIASLDSATTRAIFPWSVLIVGVRDITEVWVPHQIRITPPTDTVDIRHQSPIRSCPAQPKRVVPEF